MPSRFQNSRRLSTARKTKKTFTLSRESVNFLEAERRKRAGKSASLVLEEIIGDHRRRKHSKSVDAAISACYDSLSDEERLENKRWGEFSESQLPPD